VTNELSLTVRYCETDRMGIVHHSRYYPWFEMGRTAFFKQMGYSYGALEKEGVQLPLTETHCSYLKGACYEDELIIQTRLTALTAARCEFSYTVLRADEKLAQGRTVHGFVDGQFRPIALKKKRPELWQELAAVLWTDSEK